MSNETDTGGQAFACQYSKYENQGGMTLLDYFAGQIIASGRAFGSARVVHYRDMAKEAYDFAAIMIAEKRRRESE